VFYAFLESSDILCFQIWVSSFLQNLVIIIFTEEWFRVLRWSLC